MARKCKTALSFNLTSYRKKAMLTQAQVAAALGIDRSTYAYYESGTNPKPEILLKLADIYKISPGKFLEGTDGFLMVVSNDNPFADNQFIQSFNELSDREKALILQFRAFSDTQKSSCEKALKTITESESK